MNKSANTTLMRAINKELVREELRRMKKATKLELAYASKLSIMTVGTILEELLKSREIFEGEMIPSNGGRPSMQYVCNTGYSHGIVLYGYQKNNKDLLGLIVINLVGDHVYKEEVYLEAVHIESFVPMIDRAIERFPTVEVIGFALPGEEVDGEITLNDYKEIIGRSFMPYYRHRYGKELIFINDINAAASGFFQNNSEICGKCTVGFYFPRIHPPGAGIIIDGKIHTGKSSFAGEFFYMGNADDWYQMNYQDNSAVIPAIGDLMAIFSSVLAPERFVLYGDFWQSDSKQKLERYIYQKLSCKFSPDIHLSTEFEADFVLGAASAVLDKIKEKISGLERD